MAFNTNTLAEILIGFGKFTNLLVIPRGQFLGTADTLGTTSILKDTELNVLNNDAFSEGHWIYVTSGAALGDVRKIYNSEKEGGFIYPELAFSGAPASASAYQVWKADPYNVVEAINRATESIYDKLFKPIIFTKLGYDDLASNANAAQADVVVSDGSRYWVGQPCTLKDSTYTESCTVSSISSNTITMTANLTYSYTTADDAVLYGQSGRYWRVPDAIGQATITAIFRRDDTPADGSAPSARKRHTEWSIVHSVNGERQIYFPNSKSVNDQTWVVEAMGKLEEITLATPAGTITIDDHRLPLLYCRAAYHYYGSLANELLGNDRKRMIGISREFMDREKREYRDLYMPKSQEIADMSTDSDYDNIQTSEQSTVRWY